VMAARASPPVGKEVQTSSERNKRQQQVALQLARGQHDLNYKFVKLPDRMPMVDPTDHISRPLAPPFLSRSASKSPGAPAGAFLLLDKLMCKLVRVLFALYGANPPVRPSRRRTF
jgi:hypothetical protein